MKTRALRRRYGHADYWDAPGRIASLEAKATREWSQLAGEPVTVEVIGGVIYAFGSEPSTVATWRVRTGGPVAVSRWRGSATMSQIWRHRCLAMYV